MQIMGNFIHRKIDFAVTVPCSLEPIIYNGTLGLLASATLEQMNSQLPEAGFNNPV